MNVTDYSEENGIPYELGHRISEIIRFIEANLKSDVIDFFVSNSTAFSGNIIYNDLYLFTDKYIIEARGFEKKADLRCFKHWSNISHWHFSSDNTNFKTTLDSSALFLYIYFQNTKDPIIIKTSGPSCNFLKNLFFKYLQID